MISNEISAKLAKIGSEIAQSVKDKNARIVKLSRQNHNLKNKLKEALQLMNDLIDPLSVADEYAIEEFNNSVNELLS